MKYVVEVGSHIRRLEASDVRWNDSFVNFYDAANELVAAYPTSSVRGIEMEGAVTQDASRSASSNASQLMGRGR